MVKILDCTTRDGGHVTNWEFDDRYILNHIKTIQASGIDFYEIGYRNFHDRIGKGKFFYCNKSILEPFYNKKGNLHFGVMADTSRFNFNDFENAKEDYIDFVRIATHPDRIKDTLEISKELHNRGYNVIAQIMEIPNVMDEHYKILEQFNQKNIFECIYIADTYSTVKPADIEKYFNRLKNMGYKNISFHAHNKHGLALENTLRAIELGAYSVDVTANGLGNNLATEDLFAKLN